MFKTSKTSFNNRTFFENYGAHLNQLTLQAKDTLREYSQGTNSDRLSIIGTQTLKRLRMFDPFYDRFDVADEVMGATVVPLIIAAAAAVCTLVAVWETGHMLAIKAGIARNDHKEHADNAVMFFLAGMALSALAVIVCVKSIFSLITRSLLTLDGKAKSSETRFNKEPHFARAVDVLGIMAIDKLDDAADGRDSPTFR